jgi:hypothetical protein
MSRKLMLSPANGLLSSKESPTFNGINRWRNSLKMGKENLY